MVNCGALKSKEPAKSLNTRNVTELPCVSLFKGDGGIQTKCPETGDLHKKNDNVVINVETENHYSPDLEDNGNIKVIYNMI